jgi:hypothetical protein
VIKLEDKTSGELFAKANIDDCPGPAIESVSDSSRYFVLRIQDDNSMSFSKDGDDVMNDMLILCYLIMV